MELTADHFTIASPYRILSLDGGGAKGFYTLGALKEIEALARRPLHECFDLIFGTSTGAIIAALLALGHQVDDIHGLYKEHVPSIMRQSSPEGRTKALTHLATTIFGNRTFVEVKTGIGIVATHWAIEKPMIFKGAVEQAHGRASTFVPGFGCSIGAAVVASCSAYPFFKKFVVRTGDGQEIEAVDGGYCANNPTLFAIADAVKAFKIQHSDLRVVSVGVGVYPEPKRRSTTKEWFAKCLIGSSARQLLQKTLNVNTASMEQLRSILFKDIDTVRINDTFEQPEMATDLMESDLKKLAMLYQRGRESFARYEPELKEFLVAAS
jgi:patatin-like phospholipase/acyl hydrolase